MPSTDMPSPRAGRPRLDDVARRAGVSIGTVSNVLNHPDRVSTATRSRVGDAIEQLGFQPNSMASSLARGTSRTIGLVLNDISNSLFVDMARGAQRAARECGYYLQLATCESDDRLFDAHVRVLDAARVAGILASPMSPRRDTIERLRRHGSPVVVLNHDDREQPACRVLIDNEQAGYIAAKHLIGLGRRRIAFIAGRDDLQPVALRRAGVHRAIAETGGAVELTEHDVETLEPESGVAVGRRFAELPAGERPDAVLGVTDLLAMAIISEFAAAGIAVPGDVAVMGCDHNSAAWGGAVPLTSVSMEGERMGAVGLRLLLQELEEPADHHAHATIILQPSLMVRESTVGRSV